MAPDRYASQGGFARGPLRESLRAIYSEVDRLLGPYSCPASTECCRFGITGREPYPTAIELAEIALAVKARPLPKAPPEAGVCPFLSAAGKCRIYDARPFGCRTYFCERVTGPGKLPRAEIQRLGRAVLALSEKLDPADPGPRPLTAAMDSLETRW